VTGTKAIVAVYRTLLFCYPRAFRVEYGDDMTSVLREQLRDESPWRVCGRTLVDLIVTVPTLHVEAHMARTRTPALVLLVSFGVAAAAFALVEGAVGLAIAALGAIVATLIWRRERPARADREATAKWWKLLGSGGALLGIVIAATAIAGELSDPAWAVAAVSFLASVGLLATGVGLGLIRLSDRRRPTEAAG
jgi:hypothetical protein